MSQLGRLRRQRRDICRIAQMHGGTNVRIFGSAVRGEETCDSDIDFLIHLESGRSYFDYVRLKRALEEYLSCPVDVILDSAIKPMLRDEILHTAQSL